MVGVDFRVVEPGTVDPLPWDGETSGELQVRGAVDRRRRTTTTSGRGESFTDDGWLRTGDVATVDADGYIRLVDRTKDLIKSGGEWISSVELENELMAHPKIREAAVIGVPHPRWSERPLACVVLEPGEEMTVAEVIDHLDPSVAKWQLPDDVVFIDEVPKTSVGKFSKQTLRERFADYQLPAEPFSCRGPRRTAHDGHEQRDGVTLRSRLADDLVTCRTTLLAWRQESMKPARLAGFQALKKSAWYVYGAPEARLIPALPLVW